MKKYRVETSNGFQEFLTSQPNSIEIEIEEISPMPRIEISERQIKFALIDLGIFDAIDGYVQASVDKKLKVAWAAPFFWSDNELVMEMGQMLGKTNEEIYQIFQYGATL